MQPRLYSKDVISLSTAILSPLLGSILFANNLRETGQGRVGPFFIIGGVLWNFVLIRFSGSIVSNQLVQFYIGNITASLLFTFVFWDQYFGNYPSYEKKNALKPVLIFIGICIALVLFQVLASKR